MPSAFIVGVASQDGSYLAEFLLSKKYRVIGSVRPGRADNLSNISHLKNKITRVTLDLLDPQSVASAIRRYQPQHVYNLAALSVPVTSWSQAYLTGQVNALGPVLILEAIKAHSPHSRFFQASSREIFGAHEADMANESAPVSPRNPYAVAKAYAHFMTQNYRRSGLFAVSGILFNHESPRRPLDFVTRKITLAAASLKAGVLSPALAPDGKLHLWDLSARRDRGYAKDYVQAMWLMLRSSHPHDYVIASGQLHSVGETCEIAFSSVGLNWRHHVVIDGLPDEISPSPGLAGDSTAIRRDLGWHPRTSFRQLIKLMVSADQASLS